MDYNNNYQRDYSVILAGDFNARTGMENDFTVFDSCKFAPSENLPTPKEVPARKNFDQHLNEQGNILLEICKSLDLRILNGRCKGDSFGKITFHGKQGISTVDYIIVSHDLMDKFQKFCGATTFSILRSFSVNQLDKDFQSFN